MAWHPHISIVTLGVADVAVSTAFYERLGWKKASGSNEHISFFKLSGTVFGLYGRAALAEDAEVSAEGNGFRGVTLAHNLNSRAEVDEAFAFAVDCGATPIKEPQEVFWGGYSGYIADPDGHLWEIAHNPFSPNDENGQMQMED
ncbi:MAG: VOC family protein [Planctomycetota bacterium]